MFVSRLSVNINKIATLRNSRGGHEPNLLEFAHKIVSYGAHGITIHPRADERHITRKDAAEITQQITKVEVNIEGDLRDDFLNLVLTSRPAQCTLVPVTPGELTSDHGWNFEKHGWLLEPVIKKLKSHGIRVSLFIDAGNLSGIKSARDIGADRIEIYTKPFADGFLSGELKQPIADINKTIEFAKKIGLGVNAGHDLTHLNLAVLERECPGIDEYSIGHHLISHALQVGMEKAVKDYLKALK
jgi:pyridoxine 5-phosphate synthase